MLLHNRINRLELKEKVRNEQIPRRTISFYKYHHIRNVQLFRDHIYLLLQPLGVLGRIYVSAEGINAQISVPENEEDTFRKNLDSIDFLYQIRLNKAVEEKGNPFYKLVIKIREKIVADGITDKDFDVTRSGVHLNAQSFNKLVDGGGVTIVDMRNHYESEVGHFENALLPDVDTFRDQLPLVEKLLEGKNEQPVVMYCTGGIRCEKASAYLKYKGFKNVYQLEGGIIEYVHQVKKLGLENKFHGKNFVFDDRLGERITSEIISECHLCGTPCDEHTNCANPACNLLHIACDACKTRMNLCCSDNCKAITALPEDEQALLRKGKKSGRLVYRKGRKKSGSV